MPRFLSMIRIDEQNLPAQTPDPDFETRMGALFEEITKAGVMLDTAGLAPTSQGTRVRWEDGKLSYTDGPFTETKEVVGGYAHHAVQGQGRGPGVDQAVPGDPPRQLDSHRRGPRDRRGLSRYALRPRPGRACSASDRLL